MQTLDQEKELADFSKEYVGSRGGWYMRARLLEGQVERESGGKLRIMLFSTMTILTQYLEILAVDGFLSLGSLALVWLYMWFTLESVFLASCGMFEIVFSLPVGMTLWTIVGQQKIFWYQMLVIYMILGIGADDVFILYDAWLQSRYERPAISSKDSTRFTWAYRRSFHAMLVTTATTCGSFVIGAFSPLPQVSAFCVFAAVVVFVDWVFCISFFASSVMVYERYFKGMACCCCELREPGQCLGPGCCWGGFRCCMTMGGSNWKCMPLPPQQDAKPEPRAMEKFFETKVFSFYQNHAKKLLTFWLVLVIAMASIAGALLRTAEKRAPLGRDSIDAIKGFDILLSEFSFRGAPLTHFAYGLKDESPIKTWGDTDAGNVAEYGGTSSALKQTAKQMELLQLCRAPDVGKDSDDTRCDTKECLVLGNPLKTTCEADQTAWRQSGIYIPADPICANGRYCWMEDFTYFWAYHKDGCSKIASSADCSLKSGCSWDTNIGMAGICYSTTDPASYTGLSETEFMNLLGGDVEDGTSRWEKYVKAKLNLLRENGRAYEAEIMRGATEVRLNSARDEIVFAFHSYNATYPFENTVDQANAWFNRWEDFRMKYGPNLGGFQTTELYLFLVTQNEMVKAATLGICLSLVVCYIILFLTTQNWWTASLGLVSIVSITATFLGIVPIIGWSLGENECIFMIATVGLSVDYTVHLLNAYNSVTKPSRAERVQGALAEMGISVANSAITTLLAALILFGCGFFFFFQFGGFIFLVIGLSIIMSTNLLMPLMLLAGPEGDSGRVNLCPCMKGETKVTVFQKE
eukprot:TRINITY_DN2423_c0_g1_i3.p1 TRINITY_DN2423_c0_g1~~TRINITY_DN2423_c0_g1_i3.p1  ORF type:complete len:948 (+),score=196.93 TRINITY_DN2423_c0_g1_i3:428-2845(+)